LARKYADAATLKKALDGLYRRYNRREGVSGDPLGFLYRYDDPRDREVAGLIAASLAFGNVKQIVRSLETVLSVMGVSPAGYIMAAGPGTFSSAFDGFRHRWVAGDALASMLSGVRGVLRRHGSLERCFNAGYDPGDGDIVPALTRFVEETVLECGGEKLYLLPSPCRMSACKRLNLFLRWMVRRDDVDPGVWGGIPASKLVIPLDTHIFRLSRAMGLTRRNQANLRTAREITDGFRKIVPDDPVRYDFSLASLGMRGGAEEEAFLRELGIGGTAT